MNLDINYYYQAFTKDFGQSETEQVVQGFLKIYEQGS